MACCKQTLTSCLILASSLVLAEAACGTGSEQIFTKIDLALQAFQQNYKVPTGIEYAEADAENSDNAPITVDFSSKDPGVVFRSMASQKPAYVWNLEDGVYELYPKSPPDRVSDMTIALYYVKDATPQEASDALTRLPELQLWLSEHHATRSEIMHGPRWGVDPDRTRISLELHNVPLRAILNQLFRKVGSSGWGISRWGDKKQFLAINF